MQQARDDGDVVMLGVIQEQHAERCRLFAQWKQFDWPILHDPLNLLELRAVPIVLAIDGYGVVRDARPRPNNLRETFLDKSFPVPARQASARPAMRPDITKLKAAAAKEATAAAWRTLGDAVALWSDVAQIDEAVDAYQQARRLDQDDPRNHFRLGVALRMRYESPLRKDGDFQSAVTAWGQALELDPNQYIYRRRIQQYGPRLIKPYPFYDWVTQAREDIAARGETPHTLQVEPSGAEIAHPARRFASTSDDERSPDPAGKINRDEAGLIHAETAVVPASVKAGEAVRLHLHLRPRKAAHWNNEAEPLRVWIDLPEGWTATRRLLTSPQPNVAESTERRTIEVEIQTSKSAASATINAYALYYVCEEADGTCLFLRQDFKIPVRVRDTR